MISFHQITLDRITSNLRYITYLIPPSGHFVRNYFEQNPRFILAIRAMFSKHLAATLYFGSPFHHLAATLSAPFTRIVFLKLSRLSSSTAGNDRPTGYSEADNTCPISNFLLNECGLLQSEISTILKRRPFFLRTRSTYTAHQALRFLRDSGFTEDQVRKIVTRNPSILTLNVDRQLKPKIKFMKTLGFTAQDFGKAISLGPGLFNCNIEKTLSPNIRYLQNLLGSEAAFSKVFRWLPRVLITSNGPEVLEKRLKDLGSFGLLEDDIKETVRRNPLILTVSMDKVQKLMDFFIHTAGLPSEFLLSCPQLLTYSLECRIKPRHKVLKSISAMQPSKRLPCLATAVGLSERKFLERYVECSPHALNLLEIYRGKPVDPDIIQ